MTFGGDDSFRGSMEIVAKDFIAVKSFRAKGKRITNFTIGSITELEPLAIDDFEELGEVTDPDISDDSNEAERDPDEGKSEDEVRDELTGQQRIF